MSCKGSAKMIVASIVGILFTGTISVGLSAAPQPRETEIRDSSEQIAKTIVDSKKPVVVDFWAAWCGPCRMLNPILKKLEGDYKDKVVFLKVNIDFNPQITSYFGVQGIPAVFIIRDQAVQRSLVGLQPEASFRHAIDEVLALPAAPKDSSLKKDGKKAPKGTAKTQEQSRKKSVASKT